MRLTGRSTASWLVGLVALTWGGAEASAQAGKYTPGQHRAWYIYLVSQYTRWPSNAFASETSPFVVGILGRDPFGRDIDIIKDKPVKKHLVKIRYFDNLDDLKSCHALYVAESEAGRLPDVLQALGTAPVLTFSEIPGFLGQQGIVRLWLKDIGPGKAYLYFEINQAAAERVGLRISSHVLNLAKPAPGPP